MYGTDARHRLSTQRRPVVVSHSILPIYWNNRIPHADTFAHLARGAAQPDGEPEGEDRAMFLSPYRYFRPVKDNPVTLPSVFGFYKPPLAKEKANPCQKQVWLLAWIIRHLCPKGLAVYDAWAGSGSGLVAALMEQHYVFAVDLQVDHVTGRFRQFKSEISTLLVQAGLMEEAPAAAVTPTAAWVVLASLQKHTTS